MKASAAMLEYMLSRNGCEVLLKGNGELAVSRIRPYSIGARQAETLYIADSSCDIPEPPSNANFAIIRFGGTVADAYDAMRELEAWDSSLKDALIDGVSLQDFVEMGREFLACPIAYFDRNLIALAASDDYWETDRASRSESEIALHVKGQLPSNRATDLIEDVDYMRAADIHGGFYYSSSHNRMYYGVNTFDHDAYLARLVAALPLGKPDMPRGWEQLFERFHSLLDKLHLHYGGNAGVVSTQNDALHALARHTLLESETAPMTRDESADLLSSFNWNYDDDCIVARIVFFEGLHWNTASLYLCGLLERTMAGSCAFPTDQQIVWLINLELAARASEPRKATVQRFTESLVSVLRTYACKAGISDVFNSFSKARNAFKEACIALEVGQLRNPHYWYFAFGDYKLDYLISKCEEDLEPLDVSHSAFTTLLALDAANGTDHARTLACFLRNSQNSTHAANELFMHRTSLIRRMERIVELTGIDLSSADEVLHLLLSAKMLGL